MKRLTFYLIGFFSLTACTPSIDSLIENNTDEAQKKFDQFYVCYEIAKTTPPIVNDKINWESDDANTKYGEQNVYQIGFESFKDLSKPLDISYDGTRRREHADMAKLFKIDLSKHVEEHNYEEDSKYQYQKVESEESCRTAINQFLNSKYLLINRLNEHAEPKFIGLSTFEPGYIKGDVLVFDLQAGKLLGGFAVQIESSQQVTINEFSDENANLMAELESKAMNLIIEKFAELTPSLKGTHNNF